MDGAEVAGQDARGISVSTLSCDAPPRVANGDRPDAARLLFQCDEVSPKQDRSNFWVALAVEYIDVKNVDPRNKKR